MGLLSARNFAIAITANCFPTSSALTLTLVNCGNRAAPLWSSKPIRLTSLGTSKFRCRKPSHTPKANSSVPAKIAVMGRFPSSNIRALANPF